MLRVLYFILEKVQHYIQAYITVEKPLIEEIVFLSVLDFDVSVTRLGQ